MFGCWGDGRKGQKQASMLVFKKRMSGSTLPVKFKEEKMERERVCV
jgi:hypothetical protein